jgi:hypothetical protein
MYKGVLTLRSRPGALLLVADVLLDRPMGLGAQKPPSYLRMLQWSAAP